MSTINSSQTPQGQAPTPLFDANHLSLSFGERLILKDVSVTFPDGKISVIIGPNGCGKSTLLKTFARLLTPQKGHIHLRGRSITDFNSKELARQVSLLPQSAHVPADICVADLVSRGRFPHQGLLQQWSQKDELITAQALRTARVSNLSSQPVNSLSGGQRQRVWLAMTLAQDTPILLLDEPTTYMDISHQLELLNLCRQLNATQGRSVVMVLHDLYQAAHYADYIVVMKAGRIIACGAPAEIITPELIAEVFSVRSRVIPAPETGSPLVVPLETIIGEEESF